MTVEKSFQQQHVTLKNGLSLQSIILAAMEKKQEFGDILTNIDDFFSNIRILSVPEGGCKIDECTKAIDVTKAIESDLGSVKAHNGNKYFIPHLKRLYRLKNAVLDKCDISINIDYIF